MSQTFTIRKATVDDQSAVVSLWRECGLVVDHNPPEADFCRAINGPSSDVLVAEAGKTIIASAMVGDDGHRGWIYYLAVGPGHQRSGLGQAMCQASEEWASQRGVRKIQLMIRPDNQNVRQFYTSAAYEETPRLVMAKWLGKESSN